MQQSLFLEKKQKVEVEVEVGILIGLQNLAMISAMKNDFIIYFKLKKQHINIYQAQNSNAAGKYFLETSKR